VLRVIDFWRPTVSTLNTLGWTAFFEHQLKETDRVEFIPARVIEEQRERFTLATDTGECLADISGRLRHQAVARADFPAVGDWVLAQPPRGSDRTVIHRVLNRMTCLSRKVPGRDHDEQILATNIDVVFVVASMNKDLNPRRVERALTLAHESGAVPVILLTKADLCADIPAALREIEAVARNAEILTVAALQREGLDAVRIYLAPGQTAVLLGSSGVGKSTLINALAGTEILATGAIREDDDRGRHTTTHRQLITLPGSGMIIDTPGIRELQLWAGEDSVNTAFEDIAALAHACRFTDCRHETEPGCAVLAAIEEGTLTRERFASYQKLLGELAYLHRRENKAALSAEKKKWKALHTSAQAHMVDKRRIDL